MADPRRSQDWYQERFPLPVLSHGTITSTTTFKMWKAPAGRSFRVDRILYINPTGLVEDTTNAFALEIKNGATSLADATFTVANATDTATIASHGMVTGAGPYRVTNSGGALPAGLTAHTNYWIIVTGTSTFKFATSRANAYAGTVLDLTGDGTGTQTLQRNLIARVFNTDSDLSPDIGATLAADAFVELAADDTEVLSGARVLAPGDLVSAVFTETGTATLPAGTLLIEGKLL